MQPGQMQPGMHPGMYGQPMMTRQMQEDMQVQELMGVRPFPWSRKFSFRMGRVVAMVNLTASVGRGSPCLPQRFQAGTVDPATARRFLTARNWDVTKATQLLYVVPTFAAWLIHDIHAPDESLSAAAVSTTFIGNKTLGARLIRSLASTSSSRARPLSTALTVPEIRCGLDALCRVPARGNRRRPGLATLLLQQVIYHFVRKHDPNSRDLRESVRALVFWAEQAEKLAASTGKVSSAREPQLLAHTYFLGACLWAVPLSTGHARLRPGWSRQHER